MLSGMLIKEKQNYANVFKQLLIQVYFFIIVSLSFFPNQ